MKEVLLIAALSCAPTELINLTEYKWNEEDLKAIERSKKTCQTLSIYKDTPCLSIFIKKEKRSYYALCGYERKKK